MPGDHLLAIDHGTQSVRALVFDLRGNLLAKTRVPIDHYVSEQPGWAEMDPEVFWQSVAGACQQLWQQPGAQPGAAPGGGMRRGRMNMVDFGLYKVTPNVDGKDIASKTIKVSPDPLGN